MFRDFLTFITLLRNFPLASALALQAVTILFNNLTLNLRLNAST